MSEVTATLQRSFKETEIGPIPVEWEVLPLRDAATFSRKPRGINLSDYEAIPFIPMELVPENGTLIEQYELKPGKSIRSGTYCEKGDILVAKITPSFENGKQGIVGDLPLEFAYATTEVYPIQAKPNCLDQMFLFHFLRLPSVRVDIAGKMEGSTGRQRVPKAVIENYPIPLPPLPEQRRIAHVLSTIQRAIAAQDALIAAARDLKRSLMQRLFTYGPGPEPAPTKATEIGGMPEHWEVVRLGEIASAVSSGLTPRGGRKTYLSSGVHFIRSQNVLMNRLCLSDIAYISEETHKSMGRSEVKPGDLLLNITGASIGRVACVPEHLKVANVNQHVCRIRLHQELAQALFVSYCLASERGQALIMGTQFGTTRQGLNYGQVRSLSVPLPPIIEQQEIARTLSAVDRKIEVEEQRKAALQALFKTMLHQLMTGQVRV
ncbi:MAG: restriction endonuclease subunit S [Anaerolineae bacterium]